MALSKPAGVVLQLVGAGMFLYGAAGLYNGGPIDDVFPLFVGVVLLLIGRRTQRPAPTQ